jgi:hypothetical protein
MTAGCSAEQSAAYLVEKMVALMENQTVES